MVCGEGDKEKDQEKDNVEDGGTELESKSILRLRFGSDSEGYFFNFPSEYLPSLLSCLTMPSEGGGLTRVSGGMGGGRAEK